MRQVSLIAWVSILALALAGCPASDEGGETSSSPSPSTPVASAPPPQPTPQATPFANPVATPQAPFNTVPINGLQRTPAPDVRFRQASKGRTDPFAAIPVQPEVTVSPNPTAGRVPGASRPVPNIPQLPPIRSTPLRGRTTPNTQQRPSRPNVVSPSASGTNRPGGGTGTPSQPLVPPPPPFVPQLPPLPEPTVAQGITVTGVVQVAGIPRAIVKVPNEPSRSVSVGDRLANGQVLVKRIEMNRGPTPVVILEQYGVEIARRVGETPTGDPGTGVPTASLPPAPPINTNS
ncbi:MAG TPA: hypothetical protein V6C95_11560 [Coleofasciculaceae cyanobacterium]